MRALVRFGALLLLTLSSVRPAAATSLVPRIHILNSKLEKRLSPGARRAIRSTALMRTGGGWGTAFVIGREGNRALLLTTQHSPVRADTQMVFHVGGKDVRVGAVRVLADSPERDYAIIEAELPPALKRIRPLSLELRVPSPDEQVYGVSFPALDRVLADDKGIPTEERISASRPDRRLLPLQRKLPSPKKTIQTASVLPPSLTKDARAIATESFAANLPSNVPGASGSALFNAKTHSVSGVVWGGAWADYMGPAGEKHPFPVGLVTPLRTIFTDLGRKLDAGTVDGAALGPIKKYIDAAR